MTTKEQIIKALETLPDDATYEDAIERLYVLHRIERGLAQEEAGQTISHEEVLRDIERWFR